MLQRGEAGMSGILLLSRVLLIAAHPGRKCWQWPDLEPGVSGEVRPGTRSANNVSEDHLYLSVVATFNDSSNDEDR